MAIRKRPKASPADIEAFGDAADRPAVTNTERPEVGEGKRVRPVRVSAPSVRESAGEWPEGVARTMLIRWSDPATAIELADVARMDDRSQHATALRALQRGLQVLKSELQA